MILARHSVQGNRVSLEGYCCECVYVIGQAGLEEELDNEGVAHIGGTVRTHISVSTDVGTHSSPFI